MHHNLHAGCAGIVKAFCMSGCVNYDIPFFHLTKKRAKMSGLCKQSLIQSQNRVWITSPCLLGTFEL